MSAELEQLKGELASGMARIFMIEAQIAAMDDDIPEPDLRNADVEGDTEGDYAFKITAVEELDGNGDPYDPPQFTVKVLGGPAQTLGGDPHIYDDDELSSVIDGDYIFLRYQNVDASYVEIGDWGVSILNGDDAAISAYSAPQDLIFVLGRVGKAYSRNVRQDHKGGIVMPAISNVVDMQTQLP